MKNITLAAILIASLGIAAPVSVAEEKQQDLPTTVKIKKGKTSFTMEKHVWSKDYSLHLSNIWWINFAYRRLFPLKEDKHKIDTQQFIFSAADYFMRPRPVRIVAARFYFLTSSCDLQ